MRKLLFRAKKLHDGGWVESDSYITIKHKKGDEREWKEHFLSAQVAAVVEYDNVRNIKSIEAVCDREAVYFAIDPETLCQYAGVDDKDGTKIFEGDIVWDEFVEEYAEITFCDGSYWVIYREKNFTCDELYQIAKSLQVRGNIHDNPELLIEMKVGEGNGSN